MPALGQTRKSERAAVRSASPLTSDFDSQCGIFRRGPHPDSRAAANSCFVRLSGAEAAKAGCAQPKLSAETAVLLEHIQSGVRAELDIAPYPERVSGARRRQRLAPERPVAQDFLRDGTSLSRIGFRRSTARECSPRRFASAPSDMAKAVVPTTAPVAKTERAHRIKRPTARNLRTRHFALWPLHC